MEENKKIVREFFEGYFIHKDKSLPDKFLASEYVLHDPSAPEFAGGREGYKKFQDAYFKPFPDHHLTIDEQFADGDRVVPDGLPGALRRKTSPAYQPAANPRW
jgi:predicted SnoaL-like aldol condensation-catalyzing enzyme